MSGLAQFALRFVAEPKSSPLDQVLRTTGGAWLMTGFGVLLAPVTEEIAFRGFLLPALAIAYDWLALERTPSSLQKWQSSSMHSRAALIFASIFSSIPFALMHAGQLQHAWGALGILYTVSLVLSFGAGAHELGGVVGADARYVQPHGLHRAVCRDGWLPAHGEVSPLAIALRTLRRAVKIR